MNLVIMPLISILKIETTKQDEEYVKWDKKRRKLQNVEYEPKQIFKGCSIL